MKKLIALIILVAVCISSAYAQTPLDVQKDHWAYDSVRELANKGYVLGYPDGNFLGDRTLSRYEFATIIKRVLDSVDVKLSAINKEINQKPDQDTQAIIAKEITDEDIAAINKLVDEFKIELAVIGTRLDRVEATVTELKAHLEKIDAIVSDPKGPVQTTKNEVNKLKKISLSGYVQARYNHFHGDIYAANPTAFVPYNFSVRRARLKFTAKPTEKSTAVIQLDAGQNYAGTNPPAVTVKDAYVQYAFSGDTATGMSMALGQMKWPFGYEVLQSSSQRESPERSLVIQRFFPGERDRGFIVSSPTKGVVVSVLGIFNGAGTSSTGERNDAKDVVGTARHRFGDLDMGISGYWGRGFIGGTPPVLQPFNKNRFGADAELYLHNATLKAEYVRGKGIEGSLRDFDQVIDGYWAQATYNIGKSNTLVAKYETISEDPTTIVDYGRRSAWNLGYIKYLDDNTKLKFFYMINNEEMNPFKGDGFITEWLTIF